MSSVFAKIVRGEIPGYKIYEDEKTLAFLDIAPEGEGHTLVVPKVGAEKIYELPNEDYQAVMAAAKKIAQHYDKVLGKRMMLKVVGVDVPYAHVHILPAEVEVAREEVKKKELSEEEFRELQERLKLEA